MKIRRHIMGDLTCADKQHTGRIVEPASSNYDGTYRCGACSKRYLAAGGEEYTATQRAIFARIDNIDRRPE
jgi:hypothetical protein